MEDLIIRPIAEKDLPAFLELAKAAGPGMTNLPPNEDILRKKIELSLNSFKAKEPLSQRLYFFVLEDTSQKSIAGCCAIITPAGGNLPFYTFKIHHEELMCTHLNMRRSYQFLQLVNDFQNTSEICALFLSKNYRKDRNGEFLSRVRFLFMANFADLFHQRVMAEMRGVVDEKGRAPFWDYFVQKFFPMSFLEADRLSAIGDKQFICDFMPRSPIYLQMLQQEAFNVIGKVHPSTEPALKLLEREGFHYNNHIDIFDGGPTISVRLNQIRTLAQSKVAEVAGIEKSLPPLEAMMISNSDFSFRATRCTEFEFESSDQIVLTQATAQFLNVEVGMKVRFIQF
jgi:arginine N-succinyltransferase